jgi:hypothetical protein
MYHDSIWDSGGIPALRSAVGLLGMQNKKEPLTGALLVLEAL